uniref:Uncharacterized protein n=1 Tax=Magnetococcus massalia (strain MO-1) TaxID=451514 RepID=A0A1S7LM82_MAGMO|nr:Protein of unknown function [Candidatus Magnetococcus massalia]
MEEEMSAQIWTLDEVRNLPSGKEIRVYTNDAEAPFMDIKILWTKGDIVYGKVTMPDGYCIEGDICLFNFQDEKLHIRGWARDLGEEEYQYYNLTGSPAYKTTPAIKQIEESKVNFVDREVYHKRILVDHMEWLEIERWSKSVLSKQGWPDYIYHGGGAYPSNPFQQRNPVVAFNVDHGENSFYEYPMLQIHFEKCIEWREGWRKILKNNPSWAVVVTDRSNRPYRGDIVTYLVREFPVMTLQEALKRAEIGIDYGVMKFKIYRDEVGEPYVSERGFRRINE